MRAQIRVFLDDKTGELLAPGDLRFTWTPKVCKIMAFMAIIMGLGLLFYILLGFRIQGQGFWVKGFG